LIDKIIYIAFWYSCACAYQALVEQLNKTQIVQQ